MAKFTIAWCEVKKTGIGAKGPWTITKVTLKDEMGVTIDNVDTFDEVVNGTTVEGEITEGQYGKNFKKITPKAVAGMAHKEKVINETMQRKEQSIGKFQDNKEFSIMVASSMSQAVALATAESKDIGTQHLDERVIFWRNWIITNWNVEKTDTQPF